jgi:hypothetical protein
MKDIESRNYGAITVRLIVSADGQFAAGMLVSCSRQYVSRFISSW